MLEQQPTVEEQENNNLSEGLRELIYKANTFAETAAEIIIQAYRYAIDVDNMSPLDAAKLLKRELMYSPQWINRQLPDEAKQRQLLHDRTKEWDTRRAKRSSPLIQENKPQPENVIIKPKEEVENIITKSEIQDAEIISQDKNNDVEDLRGNKEEIVINDFFIPPNRFRKLFNDLMRFRQIAEETGIYITSDWHVRT